MAKMMKKRNSFTDIFAMLPAAPTRESLRQSFSFSSKHVRPSNKTGDDEVNLFLSDMCTKEYCQEKLTEVKESPQVVKMEIEDLLISEHSDLIPVIKSLLLSGRNWEWIRFIDDLDSADFKIWQKKRNNIRSGFEGTISNKAKYEGIVTFKCTIRVCRWTPHTDAKALFEELQKDDMVSQFKLELPNDSADEGPSDGMENQIFRLRKLVDPETGDLNDEVAIHITCGWPGGLPEVQKMFVERCAQVLHKPQEAPQPRKLRSPIRRVLTTDGSPPRPQPRRRPPARSISADHDSTLLRSMVRADDARRVRRQSSLTRRNVMTLDEHIARRANMEEGKARSSRSLGETASSYPRRRRNARGHSADDCKRQAPERRGSRRSMRIENQGPVDEHLLQTRCNELAKENCSRSLRTPPKRSALRRRPPQRSYSMDETQIEFHRSLRRKNSGRNLMMEHRLNRSFSSFKRSPNNRGISNDESREDVPSRGTSESQPRRRRRCRANSGGALDLDSSSQSSVRSQRHRRAKSAGGEGTPDFNWAHFSFTNGVEDDENTRDSDSPTPDYDWKSGVYRNPIISQAA